MSMMSSGGGLSKSKLESATAQENEVLAGETFYSGSKDIKTGSMINRGAWSTTVDVGGSVIIPQGYHSGRGTVTGNKLSNIVQIAKAPVYDSTSVSLNQTINSSTNYKAVIMIIGQYSNVNPSINISGASYKMIGTLYQQGYSGGNKFTTNWGWLYFIYDLSFPVNINVSYTPGWGNREITLYGIT